MDWIAFNDAARRWGRGVIALALLGGLWLLLGPRDSGSAPASVSGPGLSVAGQGANAGTGPDGRSAGVAAAGKPDPKIKRYVVHVAGAVRRPGVYRVRGPGRLIDAVNRAGGLLPNADLMQVNLAARLTDGRQIIVPFAAGSGGGAGAASRGAPAAGVEGAKLSLNAATAEQLDGLDGVGPAMAAAILELRTKLGGFTSVDQLDDVSGVGEKRLASLRAQVEL